MEWTGLAATSPGNSLSIRGAGKVDRPLCLTVIQLTIIYYSIIILIDQIFNIQYSPSHSLRS
jgi:hypothetical protein